MKLRELVFALDKAGWSDEALVMAIDTGSGLAMNIDEVKVEQSEDDGSTTVWLTVSES